MKRTNLGLIKVLLAVVLFFGAVPSLLAQPGLTIKANGLDGNDYEGCADYDVEFRGLIPGPGVIDSVQLVWNNQILIRHNDWKVTGRNYRLNIILKAGTYEPELWVKTDGSTVWTKYKLPNNEKIFVYSSPIASFEIVNEDTDSAQCFKGNEFCFKSTSLPGTENHKLVKGFYTFGDGGKSNSFDTCYNYASSGDFDVFFQIEDEKGCVDQLIRESYPEIYNEIGADFGVTGPVGCPCTDITFNNKTPFDPAKIDNWIWDWGTGRRKDKDTFYMDSAGHFDNWWTGFEKTYCRDGYHSPKLVIEARDGCRDSIILKDAVRVINFQFDITWFPDTPCFAGNGITFNMPRRANATRLQWIFGDPASMLLNVNRESWAPTHNFVGGPGFYNISFSVTEPPCPTRDTVLCWIKLKGPGAAINLPPPPAFPANNCVKPREIPKEKFERLKYDECYRSADPNGGVLQFVTARTRRRIKKDSTFVYCNAIINDYQVFPAAAGDGAVNCGPMFEYAELTGFVSKRYFQDSGVVIYLDSGDIVKYDNIIDTIRKRGLDTFFCDSFYFAAGDSVPRNDMIWDSLPILEDPKEGVNGNWRFRYASFDQSATATWFANQAFISADSLEIKDDLIPISGGKKVEKTFWVYEPFIRLHHVVVDGVEYIYRITGSPVTHTGGQYFPPMSPGTSALLGECQEEWRTMHDSDKFKFDCKAPNLVSFTNNSVKYRLFGRKWNDAPPHPSYSVDNLPAAFQDNRFIDSCVTSPNVPWGSDSLLYLWDFGDNSDQCTTFWDANRVIRVAGANPSGDPLQCKFSTLVAPQHLYTDDGCWTAQLTVFDPVANCAAGASQPIVMEEPDGGPADPRGSLTEKDVNSYNQELIREDEALNEFRKGVLLGSGAPPCVGTGANPYFQGIDISGTIPRCGRETYWMIFNRDDEYQGEDDDPDDNMCTKVDCSIDGNGSIAKTDITHRGSLHGEGTYEVEFREVISPGVWGKVFAKGEAVINRQQYLQSVRVTEDKGNVPDGAKLQMVFTDSTGLSIFPGYDSILVFAYEEVESFWYNCGWIDEPTLALLGNQWSYQTAGCKTPGIVIKVGDCYDTFFYENYKYFLNAKSDFFISPNPATHQIEETDDSFKLDSVIKADIAWVNCFIPDTVGNPDAKTLLPTRLPYTMTFTVQDKGRNDPLLAEEDSVCEVPDSIRSFYYSVTKIDNQVIPLGGQDPKKYDSLKFMPKGYNPMAGGDGRLTNLRDTMKFTIVEPGKYNITSIARAVHGAAPCFGAFGREVWVGQVQWFRYTDSVICQKEEVTFTDSVYYYHPQGTGFCVNIDWYENLGTCLDTTPFFYNPVHNSARERWLDIDGDYVLPEYTEMIAYDFNAPRYGKNPNTGKEQRMRAAWRNMDSLDIEVWYNAADTIDKWIADGVDINTLDFDPVGPPGTGPNKVRGTMRDISFTYGLTPEFGVGVYDVTLWARDSLGCWIPHTHRDAIRVVGVDARMTICDNCDSNLLCAPKVMSFKDESVIKENTEDVPSGESKTTGKFDKVVDWKWKFGDGRDSSVLQDPFHAYLDNNHDGYTVSLFIETEQGCKDTIVKPFYIKIFGPIADFDVIDDPICVNDSLMLLDKTILDPRAPYNDTADKKRIWIGDVVNIGITKNTSGFNKEIGIFYDTPGDYRVSLTVSTFLDDPILGEIKCEDTYPSEDAGEAPVWITVLPYDPIKIELSDKVICPDEVIRFTYDEALTAEAYDSLFWDLGVGDPVRVQKSQQVEQLYEKPGRYKITLTGSGEWPICPTNDEVEILVKDVLADVEVDPSSNRDLGNYIFLNKSVNAVTYVWEIFDLPDTENPVAEFTRTDTSRLVYNGFTDGDYMVKLTVADFPDTAAAEACTHIDTVHVSVVPAIEVYNIITPNGDGENDMFKIELRASPEYDLTVFNRWGEVMYRGGSDDEVDCEYNPQTNKRVCSFWDATNQETGSVVPPSAYFYVFKYRFKGEEEMTQLHGTITVVR